MDEELAHDERYDYEPSGSPAKTLGIFFGAVLVCAICFAFGYRMGRSSAASNATVVPDAPSVVSNGPKPSAAHTEPAPAAQEDASVPSTTSAPPETVAGSQSSAPASQSPKHAPEVVRAAQGGNVVLQVAAVSKEEDADALVSALRKKNYPVFVVANQAGDKFFHVQVGPFASLTDAEAIRGRLSGDGYNPILKK